MPPIGYHPGRDVRNNVTGFLKALAVRDPGRRLLCRARDPGNPGDLHEGITAGELYGLVGRTAAGFAALGLVPGDRVLVFLPMDLMLYTAMFAIQHLGAAAVFLDGWARRAELGASAEIAAVRGIVSFPQAFALADQVPQLTAVPIRVVCGGSFAGTDGTPLPRLEDLGNAAFREAEAVEQETTALITFTTGSSGRPKGADRTHRFLAAQHYALDRHLAYHDSDVDLPVFPVFALNNIASGVPTVLPAINLAEPSPADPRTLLAQFDACRVTCTTLSPWLFRALARLCLEEHRQLPALRRVVTGGAPVSRDEVARMRQIAPAAEILVLYGSTEVEPIAHITADEWLAMRSRSEEDPRWVDEGVNVGHIDGGLEYRFLRIGEIPATVASPEALAALAVPPGEPGELLVCGEHVCRGYFRDAEATRRAKLVDWQGRVWHRTGDLGRLDESGCLWLVGRVHNAIRHASGWLFPVRAEQVLLRARFVARAAYIGLPPAAAGMASQAGMVEAAEVAEAWCVLEPREPAALDDPATRAAWTAEIGELLDHNGIVHDRIVYVGRIPLDARHHSKVEYGELRAALLQPGGYR